MESQYTAGDAVTVVISTDPEKVAKEFNRVGGKITKSAIANITSGTAYTKSVTTAHEMAELLRKVSDRENAVVCPGVWIGSENHEKFSIVTEEKLAKLMNSELGKVPGGVLEHEDGPVAARLKRGINPSCWVLLDFDNPPGIPAEWAAMDIQQRLELLEPVVPGISTAERIESRASSARVTNGKSKPKTHAWIRVNDPSKITTLKAHIGVEMVNKGLSFNYEKKSRKDRSKTVGIEARTVFDLSVLDTGRLVFCSKPILGDGMDGYIVDDAGVEIVNEGAGVLDISWAKVPSVASVYEYKKRTGVDLKFSGNGKNLSTESFGQLTNETEITVKGCTRTLAEWAADMEPGDKLRCEAPFRESSSEAAFIRVRESGVAIVYDVGNCTTYHTGGGRSTSNEGKFFTPADFYSEVVSKPYLIKNVLSVGESAMVFGDSGTMKSFVQLDKAMHVAMGWDWMGHKVNRAAVMIVLGEGAGGYLVRIRGWLQFHGITEESEDQPWLYVAKKPLELYSQPGMKEAWEREAEEQMGQKIKYTIVDTLNTNLGADGDENNPVIMGTVISTSIGENMDRSTEFVHHVGHGDKGRERGTYALRGNVDNRWLIKREGKLITIENPKQKDRPEIGPMHMTFTSVTVGIDEDGDPITTLVMVPWTGDLPAEGAKPKIKFPPRNAENQLAALYIYKTLVNEGTSMKSGAKVDWDVFASKALKYRGQIDDHQKRRDMAKAVSSLEGLRLMQLIRDADGTPVQVCGGELWADACELIKDPNKPTKR